MRLTVSKVESWRDRIERSHKTLANVRKELAQHYPKLTGCDLQSVTFLASELSKAEGAVRDAGAEANTMLEREQRKAASK
jgi:hypothetical protein